MICSAGVKQILRELADIKNLCIMPEEERISVGIKDKAGDLVAMICSSDDSLYMCTPEREDAIGRLIETYSIFALSKKYGLRIHNKTLALDLGQFKDHENGLALEGAKTLYYATLEYLRSLSSIELKIQRQRIQDLMVQYLEKQFRMKLVR